MALNFPTTSVEGYVMWPSGGIPSYIYTSAIPGWMRNYGTAMELNRFVNPAMRFSQQYGNTDVTNQSNYPIADQWFSQYVSATGSFRMQRVDDTVSPDGSQYRLRMSVEIGDLTLSGDWLAISTVIEGTKMSDFLYGTADAKWSVIRFGCRAPAGTYNIALRNQPLTRSFIAPFTVTAANANKDHVQIIVVPPCVDGAWAIDNNAWVNVHWIITNANFTSNVWAWLNGNFAGAASLTNTFMRTVGNTFELFDVGWYLDPNITGLPPEFQAPNYEDDFAECQRYWCKVKGLRGIVTAATQVRVATSLPVWMRTVPAVSMVGTPRVYDGAVAPNATSMSGAIYSQQHVEIFANAGGGLTPGRSANLIIDIDETMYIACNARM